MRSAAAGRSRHVLQRPRRDHPTWVATCPVSPTARASAGRTGGGRVAVGILVSTEAGAARPVPGRARRRGRNGAFITSYSHCMKCEPHHPRTGGTGVASLSQVLLGDASRCRGMSRADQNEELVPRPVEAVADENSVSGRPARLRRLPKRRSRQTPRFANTATDPGILAFTAARRLMSEGASARQASPVFLTK